MHASEVGGWVTDGFESVAEVFTTHRDEVGRGGAGFAAYVDGVLAVHLWAGDARPSVPWAEDTLGVLMSATKGVTTLALQVLVDRGDVDVDAPVAAYWPEFAQAGKQRITVAQVLSHTSGVAVLPGHAALLDLEGRGWDRSEALAGVLAGAPPAWEPGTRVGYHALTFGWLVGELVRRVAGLTLGAFVADHIAGPLALDLRIGTHDPDLGRVAEVIAPPAPSVSDRGPQAEALQDPTSLPGKAYVARAEGSIVSHIDRFINARRTLAAELGGSNGTATAEALARLYAALACGGAADGVRVLSEETVSRFAAQRSRGADVVLLTEGRWGLGYQRPVPPLPTVPDVWGPEDRSFGHCGFGGQFGYADPVNRVSLAFVRSHLTFVNTLGAALVDALYDCVADRSPAGAGRMGRVTG